MSRPRHFWTSSAKRSLAAMWHRGESIHVIATAFDVSYQAIAVQVSLMNLPRRRAGGSWRQEPPPPLENSGINIYRPTHIPKVRLRGRVYPALEFGTWQSERPLP